MRRNLWITCIVCLTACLAAPILALDQEPPHQSGPIDLDFPGGTATEYVAALRKAAPGVNIVLLANADFIHVPAVTLRRVDPGAAVQMLRNLPREQGDRLAQCEIEFMDTQLGDESYQLITIGIQSKPASPKDSADFQVSRVYSVADLLSGSVKAADLLTAVEATLEMSRAGSPAKVKFHEATGLLIATGTVTQMDAINNVISQLRDRKNPDQDLKAVAQDLGERLKRSEMDSQECRKLIDQAQRETVEYRTRFDLLQDELKRLRAELTDREGEIRRLEAQLTAAQMQMQSGKAKP